MEGDWEMVRQERHGGAAREARAAIYARVSRAVVGERAAVERQLADCRERCHQLGVTVVDEYVDNDVSAYSKAPRPEFERLKADLRAGVVNTVVVWHTDRLYRRTRDLEDIVDLLEETGAELHVVTESAVDLSTPGGRTTARVLAAVAAQESEDKARRLRRKQEELAREGKLSGTGKRPFGFEADYLTVRESEAELIRQACAEVLAGRSLYSICQAWNEAGITTSTGKRWNTNILKQILYSARVVGKREHPRVGLTDAVWPAILSEDDWTQLRSVLSSHASPGPKRTYLLSGMIECGLCGERLTGTMRSYPVYVCKRGKNHLQSKAEDIEQRVVEYAVRMADTYEVRAKVMDEATARGAVVADVLRELREAEAALDAATHDAYVTGVMPKQAYAKVARELEARVAMLNSRAAELQGATVLERSAGHVAALWDDLSLEDRRSVISGVVSQILLRPSRPGHPRKFDHERLVIRPRWKLLADGAVDADWSDEEAVEEYRAAGRES